MEFRWILFRNQLYKWLQKWWFDRKWQVYGSNGLLYRLYQMTTLWIISNQMTTTLRTDSKINWNHWSEGLKWVWSESEVSRVSFTSIRSLTQVIKWETIWIFLETLFSIILFFFYKNKFSPFLTYRSFLWLQNWNFKLKKS